MPLELPVQLADVPVARCAPDKALAADMLRPYGLDIASRPGGLGTGYSVRFRARYLALRQHLAGDVLPAPAGRDRFEAQRVHALRGVARQRGDQVHLGGLQLLD